jgi:hypothetical protein
VELKQQYAERVCGLGLFHRAADPQHHRSTPTVLRMSVSRRGRRVLAFAGAVALATTLAAQTTTTASAREVQYPTGAGAVYKWGPQTWRDEYEAGIGSRYDWQSRPSIEDRYGMLVLKGRGDGSPVGARLLSKSYRYGRWETRIHMRQWENRSLPFRMIVELVPRNPRFRCGAHDIVVADYTMGDNRVHMAIRNGKRQFTYSSRLNLGHADWNTYAVEVARKHISWFVNDHVVMTERRPAALSGINYTLHYRWVGPRTQLQAPWMQMDWSRYYSMRLPNQKSIKAPNAHRQPLHLTCR